jgi:hypothetical protein
VRKLLKEVESESLMDEWILLKPEPIIIPKEESKSESDAHVFTQIACGEAH